MIDDTNRKQSICHVCVLTKTKQVSEPTEPHARRHGTSDPAPTIAHPSKAAKIPPTQGCLPPEIGKAAPQRRYNLHSAGWLEPKKNCWASTGTREKNTHRCAESETDYTRILPAMYARPCHVRPATRAKASESYGSESMRRERTDRPMRTTGGSILTGSHEGRNQRRSCRGERMLSRNCHWERCSSKGLLYCDGISVPKFLSTRNMTSTQIGKVTGCDVLRCKT